jgi:predicted TIM-barrel fold metal-dependent hydrolase
MLTRRDVLYRIGAAGVSAMALRTVAFAAADTVKTAVNYDIPAGACDCHVHVFGDPAKFPFAANRVYTPPEASITMLSDLHQALRMQRVVIVQPSVYGTDNSCTLDAVRRIGAGARAVAVIDQTTSREDLVRMDAAGVRGVRLNLETGGTSDPSVARTILASAVEKITPFNWHVQLYSKLAIIAALKDELAQLPIPVVFDHFGAAKAALGPGQPGYEVILELVKSGRAYVKISGAYRVSDHGPDFPDATAMAQALVAANSERIVWGTDWPHPNPPNMPRRPVSEITPPAAVDDGLLLNQLAKWVPDAGVRKKILVDNPARLYGFQGIG